MRLKSTAPVDITSFLLSAAVAARVTEFIFFPMLLLKKRLPQLYQYGDNKHSRGYIAELDRLRMQDLVYGGFHKLYSYDDNKHGYKEPRKVFYSRVSIRVILVLGL